MVAAAASEAMVIARKHERIIFVLLVERWTDRPGSPARGTADCFSPSAGRKSSGYTNPGRFANRMRLALPAAQNAAGSFSRRVGPHPHALSRATRRDGLWPCPRGSERRGFFGAQGLAGG